MRHPWLLTCLLALASSAAQARLGAPLLPTYIVRVDLASPQYDRNEIALLSRWKVEGRTFWIAERWRRQREWDKVTTSHDWVDGRSCPGLARTVEAIAALPPLKFGTADDHRIPPSHFTSVTLRGPAAENAVQGTLSGELIVTGVNSWWSSAEAAMKDCWTAEAPSVRGSSITPHMASDAEAETFRTRVPF